MSLKYLFLAAVSFRFRTNNFRTFHENRPQSEIWLVFNKWLQFTYFYISPSYWAMTPLFRQVTLCHLEEYEVLNRSTFNDNNIGWIDSLAKNYSRNFFGVNSSQFKNWLLWNFHLLLAFKDSGCDPLASDLDLVEIGPGFGAVTSLVARSTGVESRKIFSLDSMEMNNCLKIVHERVLNSYPNIKYVDAIENSEFRHLIQKDLGAYFLIAFWSLTEVPLRERKRFEDLIVNADFSIIASNRVFEGVDNFEYLEEFARRNGLEIRYVELNEIFGEGLPGYSRKHRLYLIRQFRNM